MSAKLPAEFLFNNRQHRQIVSNIPVDMYPSNTQRAYDIQNELVNLITDSNSSSPCGYKVACTNKPVMQLLGADEPFCGKLLSHSCFADGIVLSDHDFTKRIIEAEFVFRMGADVIASDTPYNAVTIQPYIECVYPAIEIVTHCYKDFTQVGALALIADNAIHGASIIGEPCNLWRDMDLAGHAVSLHINQTLFDTGFGRNVLDSPLNVMAWLANHLNDTGTTLRAGEWVTTGTACEIYNAVSGDHILADFGDIGTVSLSFD